MRVWCLSGLLLGGCVGAADGGPNDGAPRRYATEQDATAAQAAELLDEEGHVGPPEACTDLLTLPIESDADEVGDDETQAATERFQEAQLAYTDGHYAEALSLFCETYRLRRARQLLYNIGVTYERLGLWLQAADHFESYAEAQRAADEPVFDNLDDRVEALRRRGDLAQ